MLLCFFLLYIITLFFQPAFEPEITNCATWKKHHQWNYLGKEFLNIFPLLMYRTVFYYSGPRNLQIMHTSMRTQCSALNSHLFNKNMVNFPLCLCRSRETSKHFLLLCPRYEHQRLKMLNLLRIILTNTPVLTITTDLLLSGSEHLSVDKNTRLFDAVFKFISESKRFGN